MRQTDARVRTRIGKLSPRMLITIDEDIMLLCICFARKARFLSNEEFAKTRAC